MRKIFMILLICLTMSLTANFLLYSQDNGNGDGRNVTIDGNKITFSVRETSKGTMVELSKEDYRFILETALSEKERADLWKERYDNLMDDTVWVSSYEESLQVISQQEKEIHNKENMIKILGGTTAAMSLAFLTSLLVR